MVAAVAADEPETAAKMAQPKTLTCRSRPGTSFIQGASPLNMSSDSRERNKISPIQMNSGSAAKAQENFPGLIIAFVLYGAITLLLVLQPDMGMAAQISTMFFAQFFVAGMPLYWIGLTAGLAAGGAVLAYATVPHVTLRVDRFLDPALGDNYQVATGLEAFMNGGLLGRGPGEGTIKEVLPDAHSDFIFAVAGEELGLLACLLIVVLFAFVVVRGISRSLESQNLFVLLAVTGLITQFGLQALIHMASTLNLMPTKGMTLPFISYGGSSLIGIAITMGMVLALTRKRVGLAGT